MTWYFYNNRGVIKQEGVPDSIPVGVTTYFTTTSGPIPAAPTGWLLCDGSVQLTATYPELATILSFPAAPGVNFTLPNLSTRFPVGTSGTYPVKSTGGIAQHPHSISSHTHSNTHTHTVNNHDHAVNHRHTLVGGPGGTSHTHTAGTYKLDPETGAERHALDTGGGATRSAKGPGSGNSHEHDISGTSNQPNQTQILDDTAGLFTGLDGGTAGGEVTPLTSTTPGISPVVDVLPPYLNVYFLIKAIDLSGTYV